MATEQINKLVGVKPEEWEKEFKDVHVFNHEWSKPETFITLGTVSEQEVAEISNGKLCQSVDVRINRLITEYDQIIVCGPVFPHEVVGFSGGNKYFFPGISGPEVIDLSHWLGALITSYSIIGKKGVTPVRKLINRAASMIDAPKLCFAMVVALGKTQLAGLYIGAPEVAWAEAVELSAHIHVKYVDHTYKRVLSIM